MDRSIFTGSAEGGRWFLLALRVRKTARPWVQVRGLGLVAERIEASTEPWDVAPSTAEARLTLMSRSLGRRKGRQAGRHGYWAAAPARPMADGRCFRSRKHSVLGHSFGS
jgi:hypothetical protein